MAAVGLVILASVGAGVWTSLPHPGAAYAGQVRTYYIASNEIVWNYTPAGTNEITGEPFGDGNATELQYTTHNASYLGTSFLKCVYQQYPNASFLSPLVRPASEAYLGILGPVIYAVTGDTIVVVFKNNCRFNESVTPLGLPPATPGGSLGVPYNGSGNDSDGGAVPTGATFTYSWSVPEDAGPTALDNGSTLYEYTSGTWENSSLDAGLVGPIVVSAPSDANPNGTPDRFAGTIIELFAIFQEGNSPYLATNIARFAGDPADAIANESNPNWDESLNKYAINGYLYGNQPLVTLVRGESYQWLLLGAGADMHAPHWHGNTVVSDGMRTDVVTLLPGQTVVADMTPDDPGIWLFHCHVDDHLAGGMVTRYQVVNATAESTVVGGGAALAAAFVHGMLGDSPGAASSERGSEADPWDCGA